MERLLITIFLSLFSLNLGIIISANNTIPEALLFITISAIAFSFICFRYSKKGFLGEFLSWKSIEDSNTLFDASAFWATIIIGSLFSFTYAAFNISGLETLEAENPAKLLFNIMKEPVITFGLSLPIIALIANHHRSLQTHKQIEVTKEQNYFNNYLKHFEEFDAFLARKTLFTYSVDSFDSHEVHRKIFDESLAGNLKTGKNFHVASEELKNESEDLKKLIVEKEEFCQGGTADISEATEIAINIAADLKHRFALELQVNHFDSQNKEYLVKLIESINQAISDLRQAASFIFLSPSDEHLKTTQLHLNKANRVTENIIKKEKRQEDIREIQDLVEMSRSKGQDQNK